MNNLRISGTGAPSIGRLPLTAERLAELWPEASRRLQVTLQSQGIDRASAEDLVSEAVTRALAIELPVDTVDDFCRWSYRVARNLHVDQLRARARLAPEPAADAASSSTDRAVDVPHEVEQRILCERTLRSIATLSAVDRSAILAGLDAAPEDPREATRIAVRRHRARARLLKLVGGISGLAGVLRASRRWIRQAPVAVTPVAFLGVLLPGVALLAPHAGPGGVSSGGDASTAVIRSDLRPDVSGSQVRPLPVAPRARSSARAAGSSGPNPSPTHTVLDVPVPPGVGDDDGWGTTVEEWEESGPGNGVLCLHRQETGTVCTPV